MNNQFIVCISMNIHYHSLLTLSIIYFTYYFDSPHLSTILWW